MGASHSIYKSLAQVYTRTTARSDSRRRKSNSSRSSSSSCRQQKHQHDCRKATSRQTLKPSAQHRRQLIFLLIVCSRPMRNVQRAACSVRHATCNMHNRNSQFALRRSPVPHFAICQSQAVGAVAGAGEPGSQSRGRHKHLNTHRAVP